MEEKTRVPGVNHQPLTSKLTNFLQLESTKVGFEPLWRETISISFRPPGHRNLKNSYILNVLIVTADILGF